MWPTLDHTVPEGSSPWPEGVSTEVSCWSLEQEALYLLPIWGGREAVCAANRIRVFRDKQGDNWGVLARAE